MSLSPPIFIRRTHFNFVQPVSGTRGIPIDSRKSDKEQQVFCKILYYRGGKSCERPVQQCLKKNFVLSFFIVRIFSKTSMYKSVCISSGRMAPGNMKTFVNICCPLKTFLQCVPQNPGDLENRIVIFFFV